MRTYSRGLKFASSMTLAFFLWSFGPLFQIAAFAAEQPATRGQDDRGTRGKKVGTQATDYRSQAPASSGERFEKALEDIREAVGKAEKKHERGEDDKAEREHIRAKRAEIESADSEFKKEFAATEKKLKDAGLPQEILDRHYKFVKHYQDNLKELKTNLDDVVKPSPKSHERRAAIAKAKAHLEKTRTPSKHVPLDPNKLPNRTREMKRVQMSWLDRVADWIIPSAEAADMPPTSADLAETIETPLTQEIRDLAQRLGGTSVSLYEYVRNVYTYEPYAGSTKGAIQTIREKTGNEWDQASLLIALYRASGIPCRYVVGSVEIPIDKAMNWLGVEDPVMAGTLLLTLGRPTSLVYLGGKVVALRTQHVWVRADVPFLYSRGATNGPGDMWVDIDPSFKGQAITNNLTATGVPTFDQANYLSTFRTESPFDFYKIQLQTFLAANHPGYVPEALAPESEITAERFGILIGQLPYAIKSVLGTYSEVPDTYRQKFSLSITNQATSESLLYFSVSMPQIIGKRLTISYKPATNSDEALIANYGGIYNTPAYLLHLKPQIKLDGVVLAEGNAGGFGTEQKLDFNFDTTIDSGRVENIILAGGYYAISLSTRYGGTRESILERTTELAARAGTIDFNDPTTLDEKLGEILYLSGAVYHQNLDALARQIAAFNQVVDVRDVSEIMYFLTVKVDSLFGIPRKVTPVGITGDMDRDLHTVVPADGDMNRVKPFMQLVGNVSSYLEHSVTERIYQTEALSAVKAIQMAHDQGIPVHTITSQNIGAVLPLLRLSSELKAYIANAVNAGQEVIVLERNLAIETWSGVGYIVQDPLSGKGAYLISGGYGGVALVGNAIVEDLIRAGMTDIGSWTFNATHVRVLRFPGVDNKMHTTDDIWYSEMLFGQLEEDCGANDPDCSIEYGINHWDFAQPLIDSTENGDNAHLTSNIKVGDWRCQDGSRYMRVGTAVLTAVEFLMNYFFTAYNTTGQHNIASASGSGYRTRSHTEAIGGSSTSHHPDGVAADIVLTSDNPIIAPTPTKCEVLRRAAGIIGARGEVMHEGWPNSVHIAVPGKVGMDVDIWGCP